MTNRPNSLRLTKANDHTDAMSPDLRAVVHEIGYELVATFLNSGIAKPGLIRFLVHSCWAGPRSHDNRTGALGTPSTAVAGRLDWVLLQSGSQITAATLVGVLASAGMVIVPLEPSPPVVQASMDALNGVRRVDKPTKHRIRLRAAILKAAQGMWGASAGEEIQ